MLRVIAFIAAAGALSALVYYLLALSALRRFMQRALANNELTPPVSILKPLHGLDPKIYECLRSHCVQAYPEYEIIFGVNDEGDPVLPLVERLQQEFPQREMRVQVCREVLGANRKVSNLMQMLERARHQYVLINDADIRVPPDYLQRVMAEFRDPKVGLVTALYRGLPGRTFSSRLEALGLADFAAGVLVAPMLFGSMDFALGSTVALRREALDAVGGLRPIVNHLADDYELGQRISKAGFKVVLANVVVETALPDYSFRDFFRHQLRWARTIRAVRPWSYFGTVLSFGLPWAVLAVVAAAPAPHPWYWALLAMVAVARTAMAVAAASALRDRRLLRDLWLIPLRDLLAVAIWAGAYLSNTVDWRGQRFVLKDGKLAPIDL
ncbi:MAG TPA: bacteriohopanetetrol glucosamine biosynthesis glycosyltransferase HpnI [Terriglobales bacterium]|jgi:ceramide glucosyltransferase|nr:bacteriohopanetetrol glucosamine biosynthesis glycosyltransferase HpnI [Terriglobales bacterium]